MEEIIERFAKAENVRFELRAVNGDGEVLAKYEDYSADEVSGYADLLDQEILRQAIIWHAEQAEAERDMEGEAQMQEARDYEYDI